jgi:hypothetical protein
MWLEIHDKDGRVEISDLTFEGRHEAAFQCDLLKEELTELDNKENEEEEVTP